METAMQLTWAKLCPDSDSAAAAVAFALENPAPARWYAAYTLPRHEKAVGEQLTYRQVESFVPQFQSVRRWNNRRAEVSLPLFPGYVFVRVATGDRVKVLEHPGVVRIVAFNGRPAAIPDAEIEALKAALAARQAEPCPFLTAGKRVRIRSGALAGLEGRIVRRKGKMRFVVSVESIQRSIIFDLDAADLELSR
jgi:transcription antitermination factor NusG